MSVCDVRVLWPNGWTDQDETWQVGMQVGLGPGHTVLDGDPAPPRPNGHSPPQFSAHISCGRMTACIKMSLGMELGLEALHQGDFVLDGDHAPLPKRGPSPPNFRPMFIMKVVHSRMFPLHAICSLQRFSDITCDVPQARALD